MLSPRPTKSRYTPPVVTVSAALGRGSLLLYAAMTVLLPPKQASACSVAACLDNMLPGEGAVVPRNARGFYFDTRFWSASFDPAPVGVSVREASSGVEIPVLVRAIPPDGAFEVTWQTSFTSTTTLILEHPPSCLTSGAMPLSTSVSLAEEEPFPTELGQLELNGPEVREHMEPMFQGADCGPFLRSLVAEVTVRVALHPEVEPWRSALRFRLEVDGVPMDEPRNAPRYPQRSFAWAYGPDRSFIYRQTCDAEAQDVTLAVVADAPGFGPLRTNTQTVVVGCDLSSDAGPGVDADDKEGGLDAAASDEQAGKLSATGGQRGCSCRAEGRVVPGGLSAGFLLGLGSFVIRDRKHRRRGAES